MKHFTACLILACAVYAGDEEVREALATLERAVKTPPTTKWPASAACKALATLLRHEHEGVAEIAWTLAADPRQAGMLRRRAFSALGTLPDSPTDRVRTLMVATLKNGKESRNLRMHAAMVLQQKRFADDGVRAALEEVLLRPDGDGIVQRTCLRTLGATAELATMRRLLRRRELYEHAYFGVRVDVCAGLAALDVRDRAALEILCKLMTDDDAADTTLLVPQEAWLSFWVLTGRTHGIGGQFVRPESLAGERDQRERLWRAAMLRRGVDIGMVRTVEGFTCSNYADVVAAQGRRERIARIRNTAGLQAAADRSRRDFDAIEAEWRGQKK